METVQALAEGVLTGDRVLLSKAITLIESVAPRHQEAANQLIEAILPHTGRSVRLGITGMPGAGKSSFIETLGMKLCNEGRRVAVLAVDPSSTVSGGSLLGDKTRMEQLSREPGAFIRPTPSGGALGGVAQRSREVLLLVEAAGYDVIFIETVGVGQSEIAVAAMVDFFLAIVIAGAGDELQGVKKGLLEQVHGVAVNKADGENKERAIAASREYNRIFPYLRPPIDNRPAKAWPCSAHTGEGIDEIWQAICEFMDAMRSSGALQQRRQEQDLAWLRHMTEAAIREHILSDKKLEARRQAVEEAVLQGRLTPTRALQQITAALPQWDDGL